MVKDHYADLWRYASGNWTWISGPNITNTNGTYGTKGITSATNMIGSRNDASGWIDASNAIWIFGGQGRGSSSSVGNKNLLLIL